MDSIAANNAPQARQNQQAARQTGRPRSNTGYGRSLTSRTTGDVIPTKEQNDLFLRYRKMLQKHCRATQKHRDGNAPEDTIDPSPLGNN